MDFEQLLKAIDIGETCDCEFKSARGGFPDSFWPTYSGMANTDGGIVFFGIKEKDLKFYIEGLSIDQIQLYQKILWDNLNNRSRVNRNLLTSHHVRTIQVGQKNILAIAIPKALRIEGPIYYWVISVREHIPSTS